MSIHQYLEFPAGQNKHNSSKSSILSSILDFIKSQDSLRPSLEGGVDELSDTSTFSISSQSQQSIMVEYKYFVLLSQYFHTVIIKKHFSVFFQLEDTNGKCKFDLPIMIELDLEDSLTGKNISVLGRLWTTGAALFKKIIIDEIFENARIVLRANQEDIIPFVMNVKLVE